MSTDRRRPTATGAARRRGRARGAPAAAGTAPTFDLPPPESRRGLVPCSQLDALDQDPEIRGQRFGCFSMLSPGDVLADKNVFFVGRFLSACAQDLAEALDTIRENAPAHSEWVTALRAKHPHLWDERALQSEFRVFASSAGPELEAEFARSHDFRTRIYGFKLRGVFEDEAAAREHAQRLRRLDDRHDVHIGPVGFWLPISPYRDDVKDFVFAEASLNTLMLQHQENMKATEEFHRERVRQQKEEGMRAAAARHAELHGGAAPSGGGPHAVGDAVGDTVGETVGETVGDAVGETVLDAVGAAAPLAFVVEAQE